MCHCSPVLYRDRAALVMKQVKSILTPVGTTTMHASNTVARPVISAEAMATHAVNTHMTAHTLQTIQ